MKITYEKELREKSKELKLTLFTVDIQGLGFKCQGMADKQLQNDLFRCVLEFNERKNKKGTQ